MFYIKMGIAVLLASIPPVSGIHSFIMKSFVYFVKPHLVFGIIFSFALTILSIGILYFVTHLIFVNQKYGDRLPPRSPGSNLLIFGIIIVLTYKIILILASIIGGGAVLYFSVFGTYAEWLSLILIGLGLYKAYKAVTSANP